MVNRITAAMMVAAMSATALAAATPAFADVPDGSSAPGTSDTPTPSTPSYRVDSRILSVDVTPGTVVVRRHGSVRVTATVRTKDVKDVTIDVLEPQGGGYGHGGGHSGHWVARKDDNPSDRQEPKWDTKSTSWDFDWSNKTGAWTVHVEALGLDGQVRVADRTFYVKHDDWSRPSAPRGPKATRISGFNATPQPVRTGRKLDLRGRLEVAQCYSDWYYDWDGYDRRWGRGDDCYESRSYWHNWHWLGGQDIDVYFLPRGARTWKYVQTVETNGDGRFFSRVRASKSGTWGVRFDGDRRLKGSEASRYVKVVGGWGHR
ncbi:hypothetical protein [Microtetraspora sp. NBRC 16547]|uniref:hypothetical protein n=1 Tax=Microtetraspora sp. NBRC 16547 TaxID=3030993 RepID=UPI0024A10F7F|nr:hypothetical protein [Microtetraspora sp. NBRC 16547]GLW99741.1 hypothetical protein Misp02_38280 [Microtetraspora sp. NBRC 16547]